MDGKDLLHHMEVSASVPVGSWAASHAEHQWAGEVVSLIVVGGTDVLRRATEREKRDIL